MSTLRSISDLDKYLDVRVTVRLRTTLTNVGGRWLGSAVLTLQKQGFHIWFCVQSLIRSSLKGASARKGWMRLGTHGNTRALTYDIIFKVLY